MNPKEIGHATHDSTLPESQHTPVEAKAKDKKGPRDFVYVRKISLSNYDPRRKFETEDFACTHDSFEEARAVVQVAVEHRIDELRGVKEIETKT